MISTAEELSAWMEGAPLPPQPPILSSAVPVKRKRKRAETTVVPPPPPPPPPTVVVEEEKTEMEFPDIMAVFESEEDKRERLRLARKKRRRYLKPVHQVFHHKDSIKAVLSQGGKPPAAMLLVGTQNVREAYELIRRWGLIERYAPGEKEEEDGVHKEKDYRKVTKAIRSLNASLVPLLEAEDEEKEKEEEMAIRKALDEEMEKKAALDKEVQALFEGLKGGSQPCV